MVMLTALISVVSVLIMWAVNTLFHVVFTCMINLYEIAIVLAAGNILSGLLFWESTRFLTIKHTSCMLFPEYSTLGHKSSRLPRVFDFRASV